ncbi:MAG: glycosyltransferase family 2 protein [Actinomycetota bacterium]|nr:glycosyltransferase family 2 protein [Actinomycetota bacterium]
MQWFVPFLLVGISFLLWMVIGGLRLSSERYGRRQPAAAGAGEDVQHLSPADVAILIPAHNEEISIEATIASVLRLVPASNVHVVADGCDDDTATIARGHGVNVLELFPAHGKAGGIQAAVAHFDLPRRFAVLLIVDADTELDEHYLERGLELLDDQDMVALAGYAHASWKPRQLSIVGRFLVSYRTRLYAVMQWMKYGQTWRHTNVTPIVPGFASMYRTEVLPRMDLNPPGLVIEDFNMSFELHHKRLGKVAFRPSVFGTTQDPDNLYDYYRQICRWWLGFWQTVRRHKLWFSWFSAALALFGLEVLVASVVLALASLTVVLVALAPATGGLALHWEWYAAFHGALAPVVSPENLFFFVFVPDYLLTIAVALWLRRPSLLVYGVVFVLIRLIDSTATLWTLLRTWRARSTGRWTSPARRAVVSPAASGTGPGSDARRGARTPAQPMTRTRTAPAAGDPRAGWRCNLPDMHHTIPILRDAVLMALLLALVAVVTPAVPVTVALASAIIGVALAGVYSHHRRIRAARGLLLNPGSPSR